MSAGLGENVRVTVVALSVRVVRESHSGEVF